MKSDMTPDSYPRFVMCCHQYAEQYLRDLEGSFSQPFGFEKSKIDSSRFDILRIHLYPKGNTKATAYVYLYTGCKDDSVKVTLEEDNSEWVKVTTEARIEFVQRYIEILTVEKAEDYLGFLIFVVDFAKDYNREFQDSLAWRCINPAHTFRPRGRATNSP